MKEVPPKRAARPAWSPWARPRPPRVRRRQARGHRREPVRLHAPLHAHPAGHRIDAAGDRRDGARHHRGRHMRQDTGVEPTRASDGVVRGRRSGIRRRAGAHPVDRRDAVVARAPRHQAGVRERGGPGLGVGPQIRPRGAVLRDLDAVADDGSAAVVGGREPEQVDLRGRDRGGRQPGGRVGHGRVGNGARHPRHPAHADPVDRRDAVVAPGGRLQPRVHVGRARVVRVGHQVIPGGAHIFGHLDPVAGDARPPVARGRSPGKLDARGAVGLRVETSGGARHGRFGRRARGV